jgi:Tol biopolymer transport system component
MKRAVLLLLAFMICVQGCEKRQQVDRSAWDEDRFSQQFKEMALIANLRQITDSQRDMEPYFSISGEKIYFSRIVTPSPRDSSQNPAAVEARSGKFSFDYRSNQLFLVENAPAGIDPYQGYVTPESLPVMLGETPELGYHTPYGLIFSTGGASFNIYKAQSDSITQLTYGTQPSYMQVVSPDRRYVAFLYGNTYYRLVVLDLSTGNFYSIPRNAIDVQLYELWPQFSPDSKYLVFVESHDIFSAKNAEENVPLGDIWLAEFK